jgi:hypothetical protein
VVPLGKRLKIPRAAADAQDAEHCHQKQVSLRVAHSSAIAAIRDSLEEADQISVGAEINGRRSGLGHRKGAGPASKPGISAAAKGELDRLSGGPA